MYRYVITHSGEKSQVTLHHIWMVAHCCTGEWDEWRKRGREVERKGWKVEEKGGREQGWGGEEEEGDEGGREGREREREGGDRR